jgi:DNA-binding CsgD family transcriptional regulator
MGEDVTIDERTRHALARLTDNEKDCLRRRLQQQTAKEMALELGVSPHAVEKRLKMARAKLGLSSSLEAARLLAAFDGYQQTGPNAPDLPTSARLSQVPLHRPQVVGASIVILATAAILVLVAQSTGSIADGGVPSDTAHVPIPAEQVIDVRPNPIDARITPTAAEMELLVITNFDMLDKDRSGYLEQGENLVRVLENPIDFKDENVTSGQTRVRRLTRLEYIAPRDRNGDGKWDLGEYREWLTPHLKAGVPVEMRADIERIYSR